VLISYQILAASNLEAISFRIGQVCGSTNNGAWSTTDWVPAIVKSSIALGNFPSDPSRVVAWLAPDAVSRTIVDAAMSAEKLPFAVNLVHPQPVPWDLIMSAMAAAMQIPLIPLVDWLQQLEFRSTRATAEDIENIVSGFAEIRKAWANISQPGIKLLDFFKRFVGGAGNIEFSTSKAEDLSEAMNLNPLGEDDVTKWMHYWKEKEFIG
jgi:hypothetical protein